jgi:ubiquinone/menaquinone biosynthesis C-methylase UbiE
MDRMRMGITSQKCGPILNVIGGFTMDRPMPNFAFNVMSYMFKLRDLLSPCDNVLEEVNIEPGFRVLDYGCGPGGYIVGAAERVGRSGKVYALDIQPLALRYVQDIARKKRLTNIETILSDCKTGLPDNSVDIVLLYDIFHMLSEPQAVLAELHRVLKDGGMLSLNDHHMSEDDIIAGVTNIRLFELMSKGKHTYSFSKQA